jgi:hypothetical protein
MTKPDRQKLSVLIVLLAVLAFTIIMGYRMNEPPTTSALGTPQQAPAASSQAPSDARIRLDMVEKPETIGDVGTRNLFQYRQTPAPRNFPPPRGAASSLNPTPPVPGAVAAALPPQPQLQVLPPITLKYQGFAANVPGEGMIAFIADDSKHFNVTAGDILMGRYRIVSISDTAVQVEDLQYNRRQILPLLK